MELVEGSTLADRIAQGPVPPDEALAVAKQIADTLSAPDVTKIVTGKGPDHAATMYSAVAISGCESPQPPKRFEKTGR